jgi:ribonuclease BN (tRNA processing enzyme)
VQVTFLPSALTARPEEAPLFLTSYVINGTTAVDAGALGLMPSVADQVGIRHVFISHSHIDHVATLPLFIENVYEQRPACVVVHGSEAVLDCLRRDMFNGRLWADFVNLKRDGGEPYLQLDALEPGHAVELSNLRVTPVQVNHTVPTLGYIVEDDEAAIVITADTGPTEEIWDRANRFSKLKAVFLETSFPDSLTRIAELTKHLTPSMLAGELSKLTRPARVFVVHIKPRFHAQVMRELAGLGLPNVEIVRPGHPYNF